MWLGLGILGGWLSLIGHHWPSLAKQITQDAIKWQFDLIDSVLLMCLLTYAYVIIYLWATCLGHLGYYPQTFPSRLLRSYFLLFASMEHLSFSHWSPPRHIFQPPSCSCWSLVNPMLHLCSQPFSGHVLGLPPTIFGVSLCKYIILFMMYNSI